LAKLQSATTESRIVEEQNALLRSYLQTDSQLRWLTQLRLAALDRFSHMGWPTPQEEEWRRTDVTEIDFLRFWPLAEQRILCGGGEYGSDNLPGDWRKAVVVSLREALGTRRQSLEPLFQQGLENADNRFQAWHYSLLGGGLYGGLYIEVPPFLEIEEPLIVELAANGGGKIASPHVVIRMSEGSRATVILHLRGENSGTESDAALLLNSGMDLRLDDSASLQLVSIQEMSGASYCFHHGSARVGRDAALRHLQIELGGALVKTRVDCSLEGQGSETRLNGLYFARGTQHMDIRTVQRHRSPKGNSRAFYKGAVRDGARTIYQGLIEVCPAASKTDAYLNNKNLILNDGARADSIPSLRIDNNDVRCSHGSTTGRINEEEIFYLASRGIPEGEARRMLVLGYFEELLERTPTVIGDLVRERIESRLAPERSRG
jgi:Fe-S cluster assembly protein SufD